MRRALAHLRSAPPASKRFAGIFGVVLGLLVAIPAPTAADLGLPTTRADLTLEDMARVEAITKPTGDFSKPEQFELMQGGAGTSKKRVNQDSFSQSSANITSRKRVGSSLATRCSESNVSASCA
jgi:hypothetical protein